MRGIAAIAGAIGAIEMLYGLLELAVPVCYAPTVWLYLVSVTAGGALALTLGFISFILGK